MRFNFKLKSTEGEHTLTVDGNSGNVIISGMGGFEDAGRLLWHTLRDGEAAEANISGIMSSLRSRIADRKEAAQKAAQALNPIAAGTIDAELVYLHKLLNGIDCGEPTQTDLSPDLQCARLAMAICYCAATMRHCDAVDTIAEQRKRFESYSETMESQLAVADAARERLEEEVAGVCFERDKLDESNRELHKARRRLEDQLVLEHAKIREMKKELADMECSAERDAMETDGLREMLNDECREHKETQGTLEAVASHVERQGRIIDVLLGVIDG